MATKYVANDTYTDAELLALWRECYARISVSGQSYQMAIPGGGTQTYTSADVRYVRDQIDALTAATNLATSGVWGEIIFTKAAKS